MSKKVVFPLIAVVTLGLAAGSLGCKAEASVKAGGETKPAPPPPPPEPAKPEPPPPPAEPPPAPKALKPMGKAKIENNEIKIPGKIKFDLDKATIKEDAETKDILNTLVSVMKENPSITKLHVEGHTDDSGKKDHNQTLSNDRAQSVVDWLAKNGVDKGRLDAKGYGPDRPQVANDNEAHRETNRRVEFHVWEIDGKLTDNAKREDSMNQTAAATAKAGDKGTPTSTTATTAASGKPGTTPPKK